MHPLPTPDEMAAADRAAIAGGTPAELLMDRAGRAVARSAIQLIGGRYPRRVAIVCGKGNNGGDGFVVARVLRDEGLGVTCLYACDPGRIEGAALHHMERAQARGIRPEPFAPSLLAGADLVVDALFGTGFSGPVTTDLVPVIEAINTAGVPVVSVDIPSGVDGLTGAVASVAVRADVTVALGAQKVGTAVGSGAVHAGFVEVADIGIEVGRSSSAMLARSDVAASVMDRELDSHKRSRGSVVIVGGSSGMGGAVVLTARGAMRTGAGYVTAGVTKEVAPIVTAGIPEAVTRVVTSDPVLGAGALDELKDVLERATALAVGPGLGVGDAQRGLVERVLGSVELPIVVDADGLNVLAADPSPLAGRRSPTVITPHPGELGRLLGEPVAAIQDDRVSAARSAAARFGCTVVLKGFHSVIASPSGIVVNPTGGPELATAGTGDVLTGVIAAFLAAGLDASEAAAAGAYVHGLAGEFAGPGMAAGDVADSVAGVLEEL